MALPIDVAESSVFGHGGLSPAGRGPDGTAWCWGNNESGQLGDGTNTNSPVPLQVGTDGHWTGVQADAPFPAGGTKDDGTLWCWGNQLGSIYPPSKPSVGDTAWARVSNGDNARAPLSSPSPVDARTPQWGRGTQVATLDAVQDLGAVPRVEGTVGLGALIYGYLALSGHRY
jgi:hypothetical protein